jgi:hypothetical protein
MSRPTQACGRDERPPCAIAKLPGARSGHYRHKLRRRRALEPPPIRLQSRATRSSHCEAARPATSSRCPARRPAITRVPGCLAATISGWGTLWPARAFRWITWQIIETGTEQIDGLWGSADGTLFFYTPRVFGRWKADGVELFAEATLEQASLFQFTDLWGNSSNEVFLGVIQRDFRDYECSGVFTVWFDGAEFHLF